MDGIIIQNNQQENLNKSTSDQYNGCVKGVDLEIILILEKHAKNVDSKEKTTGI